MGIMIVVVENRFPDYIFKFENSMNKIIIIIVARERIEERFFPVIPYVAGWLNLKGEYCVARTFIGRVCVLSVGCALFCRSAKC